MLINMSKSKTPIAYKRDYDPDENFERVPFSISQPGGQRREIIGSGLCVDSPRHFPSGLFYPRFDVPPTNLRTNPTFCQQKITFLTTSAQKRYPPTNAPTKKPKKIRSNSPTMHDPHQSPSKSLISPHQTPTSEVPTPVRISTSSNCAELVQTDSTRATASYFNSIY